MSELVVLAFSTETGAQDVLNVINDLQRQGLITLDDAATVTRGLHGKPKVRQATSLVGAGAWGGDGAYCFRRASPLNRLSGSGRRSTPLIRARPAITIRSRTRGAISSSQRAMSSRFTDGGGTNCTSII